MTDLERDSIDLTSSESESSIVTDKSIDSEFSRN